MDKNMAEIILSRIPVGRSNAVTGKDLSRNLGISNRMLRIYINHLRKDNPICSKDSDGGGYWIADCDADIFECINGFRSRIRDFSNTISNLSNQIGKF